MSAHFNPYAGANGNRRSTQCLLWRLHAIQTLDSLGQTYKTHAHTQTDKMIKADSYAEMGYV